PGVEAASVRGLICGSLMSARGTKRTYRCVRSLSVFGAKRTWRDRRWRIERSLMTPTGQKRGRHLALQRAPDLILANAGSCPGTPCLGTADAIRSSETARVHYADWRCSSVAARGARTAAGDAGDRIRQLRFIELPKRRRIA